MKQKEKKRSDNNEVNNQETLSINKIVKVRGEPKNFDDITDEDKENMTESEYEEYVDVFF